MYDKKNILGREFGEQPTHVCNVKDIFFIKSRGVVVITNLPLMDWPCGLKMKIGDPIEFRLNDNKILTTNIAGIEICCPSSPDQPFAFLLPAAISKNDVPLNSKIWILPKILDD